MRVWWVVTARATYVNALFGEVDACMQLDTIILNGTATLAPGVGIPSFTGLRPATGNFGVGELSVNNFVMQPGTTFRVKVCAHLPII